MNGAIGQKSDVVRADATADMREERRQAEIERILGEYARRDRSIPADYYLPTNPAALFMAQERTRVILRMLDDAGFLPLSRHSLLEIGCGSGNWLAEFEMAGVQRARIAGIELNPERASAAKARFAALSDATGSIVAAGADIRNGDATRLPWSDGAFDLVLQSTVFSSILDAEMRSAIAAEMLRVLSPGGAIIWYDFFVNNPWNTAVRGVGAAEIRTLFPGCHVSLHRVTLAPPLARRIVPRSWTVAHVISRLRLLNTHYAGIIRRSELTPH